VVRRFAVYALALVPAAIVGLIALWALGGLAPFGLPTIGFALANKATELISVVAIGGVTLAGYLGALALARVSELQELVRAIRQLLRRS
jgi:hypothetical protein